MSSNPDDPSNNPYNEGGARSSPARQSSVWFCHSCQRDFNSNQLLHTPDPSCPYCHGDFVEETGESIDDPHEFDRPIFPFAPFLAHPPGQGHPEDGQQHGDQGQPGQQRQQGQPQFVFVPGPGQAAGPFGMLFSALSQAMQQPPQGQNQQPPRPASAPPLSPEEAARRAAERRAAGQAPEPTGSTSAHLPPEAAGQPGNTNPSGNRPPSATGGGVYHSGPATFIWSSAGHRPPPASYPSSPRQQHQHLGGEGRPQGAPQQQQQQPERQGPVRNLASFLQEAFSGGQHHSEEAQGQQQQQGNANAPQAQQAGNAPQPGQTQGHQSDPLMHMLGGLANMFGLPIHGMTGEGQQQGDHEHPHQEQPAAGPGADQHGQAPGQGGNAQGTRTRTFTYGSPGQGARIVFTFGGPPGDSAAGPIPAFLPFMMGMGGEGGPPGQMGDYVFSQGALDNIITELMNQAQGRYGPQPAPADIINNLPTFKMTKELLSTDTVNECAVCKDEFVEEEDIMKLPCNHIFHADCIKPWLERSGTCPICRYQLVPQPEPPRAPGQEGAPTGTETGAQSPPPGEGGHQPFRQESNPASPSLPRSPPITGGSSMPGSFPFGNIFSALGNFVTGGGGGQHGTANIGSSNTGNLDNNQGNRESTAARSSGDSDNRASMEQTDNGNNRQNQQQQQQSQSQQSGQQQEQGQPDLDLDLD